MTLVRASVATVKPVLPCHSYLASPGFSFRSPRKVGTGDYWLTFQGNLSARARVSSVNAPYTSGRAAREPPRQIFHPLLPHFACTLVEIRDPGTTRYIDSILIVHPSPPLSSNRTELRFFASGLNIGSRSSAGVRAALYPTAHAKGPGVSTRHHKGLHRRCVPVIQQPSWTGCPRLAGLRNHHNAKSAPYLGFPIGLVLQILASFWSLPTTWFLPFSSSW
jgi:hypothetical protein